MRVTLDIGWMAYIATLGVITALATTAAIAITLYALWHSIQGTRLAWWIRTQHATRRPRRPGP